MPCEAINFQSLSLKKIMFNQTNVVKGKKMPKVNDLEANVQNLVETKVLNLDVTLSSLVKGGAISGLDPWDIWCGTGWILRRWPPRPPISINELERIRNVIQQELGVKAGR
jgi:hypothetical protein